jgi:hypothetical protein
MSQAIVSDPKVVQLPRRGPMRASDQKWGRRVIEFGFCILPSLLLRAQRRLGVNPSQLAILIHLADYWWEASRKPYPSKKSLGARLGLSAGQVQRHIQGLEKLGLVKRNPRTAPHRGKLSNEYDLSGLVQRLQELEPEFRKAEAEIKDKRRRVAQPGLRTRVISEEST